MSVIGSNILAGASGQGGEYTLARSLRFRSDASANLYKNISTTATDRKKFTYSTWVKLGNLGTGVQVVANHTGDDWIYFVNNKLYFEFTGAILVTTQVFRDPSAWYHIMCVCDTTQATSTDRMKIYVNGSQVTSFTSNTPPALNYQSTFMTTGNNYIGCYNGSFYFFDGYMAETHHIDGQALTPSSFGETSPTTGVWQPKKYTGTYGTNGFYLPFTNNSTTTTLGNDFSGNGNNWTTNNISLTAGATYDSMTDVPTLTSATASNFAVLNPLANPNSPTVTITGGNLNFSYSAGTSNRLSVVGSIGVNTGKYYYEFTVGSPNNCQIGITDGLVVGGSANGVNFINYYSGGINNSLGSVSGTPASFTAGDIIGVAYDMTTPAVYFYKNNTLQATVTSFSSFTAFPLSSPETGGANGSGSFNFGQRPFAYTPPTGFVALNTFNLPTPTIGATASTQAGKYFDATLYTGNGSTQSIVNAGGFQPDFVWYKSRSNAYGNQLFDVLRGATKNLVSNLTDAEGTNSGVTAFNSNGFSLGSDAGGNQNAATYVGWQWRASNATPVTNTAGSITSTVSANTSSGFSIVTYTEPASGSYTVGHGLGVAPAMVIVKPRNVGGENWVVWQQYWSPPTNRGLYLNSTGAAFTTGSNWFNSASSTTFGITAAQATPGSATMVAYCFSEVAGYSKFGSYTGNGSSDGTFVSTGFMPRYVMMKRTDSTGDWQIFDTSRSPTNVASNALYANGSFAEDSNVTNRSVDFLSNGFKIRSSGTFINASGGTFIYMAFAENPLKYSLAH